MYGPRRIVLSSKPVTLCGLKLVTVLGGRSSFPIGFWYESDGKFYVHLKSNAQWYAQVNNESIANKGLGGVATQKALRQFVRAYYETEKAK